MSGNIFMTKEAEDEELALNEAFQAEEVQKLNSAVENSQSSFL